MEADPARRPEREFGSASTPEPTDSPGYPDDAIAWLAGSTPSAVLSLAADAGGLTAALLALGHDVVSLYPSSRAFDERRDSASLARPLVGGAESLPLRSSTVPTVVATQPFHRLDRERMLAEAARVLRPGGTLAVVGNVGDFSVPWVRRAFSLIRVGPDSADQDPLGGSALFTSVQRHSFRHWQRLEREGLIGFISSSPAVAVMSEKEREDVLAEAGWLYDEFGRGRDGLLMPWTTRCLRATVVKDATTSEAAPQPRANRDDGVRIEVAERAGRREVL